MERTLAGLISASYGMAKEKGWWDKPRSTHDIENNFHAEISEAWEEYRAGRMATWHGENGKPEGFYVELADLLIRLADACGGMPEVYRVSEFASERRTEIAQEASRLIDYLHFSCCESSWGSVVAACFSFANGSNVDLWEVIEEKMAYNASRSYRHGGKLA